MVDVIIPVYKPDEKLSRLIESLNNQSVQIGKVFFMHTLTGTEEDKEVDKLLKTCKGAVITPIKKSDFDHGGTRNKGATLSSAEYMLYLTQDAVPVDNRLIEELLKPMKDQEVGTVYGRQLPTKQVGPIEHYTRKFNYPDKDLIKSKKDLQNLGIKTYFCSNVCCLYRKSVYEQMGGFVLNTIFNEDMIMAAAVIEADYKIAYASKAKVLHAHKYTYRQQFTRNFDLAVSQKQYSEIFDKVKSESEGIKLVKMTMKHLLKTGRWYLIFDLIFQSGFKFLGYRFGKLYDKLPKCIVKKMTMNKAFWDSYYKKKEK